MWIQDLEPRRLEFERWLVELGAVVLEPTNPHEVVRFKTAEGTSVIYRKDSGRLTLVGEALAAWQGFDGQAGWTPQVHKSRRKSNGKFIPALLERDGDNCFYCLAPLMDDITVEHLVARGVGGPNHIDNFVLAHGQCNRDAGMGSAMQKIKAREHMFVTLMKEAAWEPI